ncbi:MAG: SAM-dependent methyltransferase [Saprospiraceae bacterium]|nr:SAM-dependent methyltransferase [Saprospiraceae bacterium]
MQKKNKGRIYLVPTPLIEGEINTIPEMNRLIVASCRYFLVESFKTGRRHIRAMVPAFDLDSAVLEQLDKSTPVEDLENLIEPVFQGHDICVLSDAGCPGIADPGSRLVQLAHHKNIEIIPLSGPSSITLALMASGYNGQQFTFHGYLSRNKSELKIELRKIEQMANYATQIFMETPYRNLSLFNQLTAFLSPNVQLCIACDLTSANSLVKSQTISQWKKQTAPNIHKRPCIFLITK